MEKYRKMFLNRWVYQDGKIQENVSQQVSISGWKNTRNFFPIGKYIRMEKYRKKGRKTGSFEMGQGGKTWIFSRIEQ